MKTWLKVTADFFQNEKCCIHMWQKMESFSSFQKESNGCNYRSLSPSRRMVFLFFSRGLECLFFTNLIISCGHTAENECLSNFTWHIWVGISLFICIVYKRLKWLYSTLSISIHKTVQTYEIKLFEKIWSQIFPFLEENWLPIFHGRLLWFITSAIA